MNRHKWIPSFTKLEAIPDKGTTSRGKYTFPKIFALAINILDESTIVR